MPAANAEKVTVLDYNNKKIEVPGDVFAEPVNEYWALQCLRHGLFFLAAQVARIDEAVRQRVNPDGKFKMFIGGNDPAFSGVPMGLLTSAFDWYAVSACKYVQTVGAIAYGQKRPKDIRKYVKAVIPEVLAFRNKVAAHYAWTTGDERDNEAERVASILPQLAFDGDSFVVQGLKVFLRSGGKTSDSSASTPWSIMRIHERLSARYWPNLVDPDAESSDSEGSKES